MNATRSDNSRSVILAIGLLLGILILGYAYFQEQNVLFYIGLGITLVGVIFGILEIVVHSKGRGETT